MLSKHLFTNYKSQQKLIAFKLLQILLKRSEYNIQCYFHKWNVKLHFLYDSYRSKLHFIYGYDIGDKLYITMKHLDVFTYYYSFYLWLNIKIAMRLELIFLPNRILLDHLESSSERIQANRWFRHYSNQPEIEIYKIDIWSTVAIILNNTC